MNYIKLINQFWTLRRSKRITSIQADLYFFLLQECNARNWENPFECANGLICAGIDVAMSSLQDARNRLQQLGLIEVVPGEKKRKHPTYFIADLSADIRHRKDSKAGSETVTKPVVTPEHKKNKQNLNQTKQNNSDSIESGTGQKSSSETEKKERKKSPAQKKKEDAVPHWNVLVAVWFDFNEANLYRKPSFQGQDPKSLKIVIENLKRRSEAKGYEWTEQKASETLHAFLTQAFTDSWLKGHFLLPNLERQFDKIITDATATKTANNGNSHSAQSAYDKFSRMDKPVGR